MRKVIVTLIAAVMIFGAAAASYGAEYADVKSTNWAHEAVSAMSDKAIIMGFPDGSFKPDRTVTYGEFIKMALIAATGEDVGNAQDGNWASNYYTKAKELGYFTEYDIKDDALNKQITRGHMALIISSILGDVKIKNYDEIQKGITDITYKTAYEYDITKAYASGILTGYTDKTFKQDKTLSRAEAAAVIYRLVDESKRVYPDAVSEEEESTGVKEKTIDEMITNLRTFVTGNGRVDDDLAEAETYEIDEAYAKYGMELHENNGTRWVSFPKEVAEELHDIYFVKNNEVIELGKNDMTGETIGYFCDITTVDYIASYQNSTKHLLLITNPFKQ